MKFLTNPKGLMVYGVSGPRKLLWRQWAMEHIFLFFFKKLLWRQWAMEHAFFLIIYSRVKLKRKTENRN